MDHTNLCLVAAAYTYTVDDFIFFEIGIQVAQTEVEIKSQCLFSRS